MALVLPIPSPISDSLGESFYKLIQISKIVNGREDAEIILDYSNTGYQFGTFLTGLFMLIKDWESQGRKIVAKNINGNLKAYFDSIRFPEGLDLTDGSVFFDKYTYANLPLITFSTNENERENSIDTILQSIFKQDSITGKDRRNVISYFISEITNNIADHSDCKNGMIFVKIEKKEDLLTSV